MTGECDRRRFRLPVPSVLWSRLLRRHRERDLDDEIRTHIEMAVRDRMARGASRAEAERAVRREFGDPGRVKEATRRAWGGVWIDRLRQDLRFGVRSLRRAPTFAVVATLTLALGIGVTTAMFTVVNGVLLRPLPFEAPERLVALGIGEHVGPGSLQIPTQEAAAVRELASFSSVVTHISYPPVTLTGAGDAVRLKAAFVSPEFHRMLGVSAAIGRGFSPGQDLEQEGRVAVLGNALWRERFGADAEVVGRSVTIDGSPYSVIGVMPAGFGYPEGADLWLPTSSSPFTVDNYGINAVARLADGASVERARAELTALAARLQGPDVSARLEHLRDVLVGDARGPLLLFLGAVLLVLVIACTNVANLLLLRASSRAREMGLRKALGAGGARVVRQLLTESVLLALVGGALGMLLATVGVEWLVSMAPPGTLPPDAEITLDRTVLIFAVAVSTLTGVVFGLAPALRSARREATTLLVAGSRTHTPRRGLARGLLLTVEVGLAVTLLFGSGLLVRSFQALRAVDLGFRPRSTLTLEVDLPERIYDDAGALTRLHGRILERFRAIPGVTAAGASNIEPFGPLVRTSAILIEGRPTGDRESIPRPVFSTATPQYLRSMGMTLLEGRDFNDADVAGGPGVALINRSMAERYWPGESAIGRRFARNAERNDWKTIVGVVEDVVLNDVPASRDVAEPMFWIPMAQAEDVYILAHVEYVVRALDDEIAVAAAMREAVQSEDPRLPTETIASMDQAVLDAMGERLFQTRLLTAFAVLALLLAAVGIFGVTAYTVSERFHEFGIRMALGAEAAQVTGSTLAHAGLLIVPGLVVGSLLGLAGGRVLSSSLYEVTPLDPVTMLGVATVLGVTAAFAALIPARRAARVDPAGLLRSE